MRSSSIVIPSGHFSPETTPLSFFLSSIYGQTVTGPAGGLPAFFSSRKLTLSKISHISCLSDPWRRRGRRPFPSCLASLSPFPFPAWDFLALTSRKMPKNVCWQAELDWAFGQLVLSSLPGQQKGGFATVALSDFACIYEKREKRGNGTLGMKGVKV